LSDYSHSVNELDRIENKRGRSASSEVQILGLLNMTDTRRMKLDEVADKLVNKLLLFEKDMDERSTEDVVATPGPPLLSAGWCLALRILNMVVEFTLEGEWQGDLIEKWREAYQMLEVLDKELLDQALENHAAASVYSLEALLLNQSKKALQIAECHFEAATVLESVETATVELVRRCVTTWHIC
jgi:hypothetical protein